MLKRLLLFFVILEVVFSDRLSRFPVLEISATMLVKESLSVVKISAVSVIIYVVVERVLDGKMLVVEIEIPLVLNKQF